MKNKSMLQAEANPADEIIRANEVRYLEQRNALIALTRSTSPDSSGISEAFRRITETTARTLNVERVSIWRYTEDRMAIECRELYQLESGAHSSGVTLVTADYPDYFSGLAKMELIAADDALTDPWTREFSASYLTPLGIRSMMDVPIHIGGAVSHILCCEHVGPQRQWTADEKTFSVAVANLISLALESSERARVESELARSHRALQMLSSCNEMLIRTSDENDLLAEACRIAVEIGGYRMAWVGYAVEDEGRRIIPMSFAGEERGYLSEIEVSWSDDQSSGNEPVGQAVRSGQPVVFEDVMEHPGISDWLAPARKRGYRSVVSLPLCDDRRPFGVLCLYSGESHPAGADELKMLRRMADDLAFGIENCRGRVERQHTEEVVIKVAQAVSRGTGSEFFDLLTLSMVEALGGLGGLIGRHDSARNAVDTISFVMGGKLMDSVSYDLAGTPCEDVAAGDICVFEQGVQQAFPDDHLLVELGIEAYAGIPLRRRDGGVAGIMVVLFSRPLDDSSLVLSTLRIFATRAAAELDRQLADARIREQASLLDKAQDAILVRDLNHTITYWNKSAERLYGWTAADAIGSSVEDLIYRDSSAFVRAHEQTLRDGEWVGEMSQIDKHGNGLIIEGRWTLVHDERGRPASVLVINTDISEHRKLEQQFLRAQRLESIGTLAGGIAHDLNNILAPISMAIELLKMRAPDERSNELLDTIANSAKRGSDMVGQVLSFARGMEGCRVVVHLHPLIQEIEKILRDTFLRDVEMNVLAGQDLWTIRGDPTQLQQVILNLCVNARDAVLNGGEIFIRAENLAVDATFAAMNLEASEGPYVCIEVKDTGEGIPPGIIDKIFDPFFTTKSAGKGSGLGLSTSQAIVKGHGGFINTSSSPGEGTVFRVYIPACPEFDGTLDVSSPTELPKGNGETVLIVDDEASIRRIAQQTLEAFGYQTLLATNGREAVSLYRSNPSGIDVVLTDMMMPVMDGAATIRELIEINPSARIIATSGITINRDLAHLAGNGRGSFLPKPYSAEALLNSLRQALVNGVEDCRHQRFELDSRPPCS